MQIYKKGVHLVDPQTAIPEDYDSWKSKDAFVDHDYEGNPLPFDADQTFMEMELIQPKTEIEKMVAERLGWDQYVFQLAESYLVEYKLEKRLNIETGQLEYRKALVRKHRSKYWGSNLLQINQDANDLLSVKIAKTNVATRCSKYFKMMNLPQEFEFRFPYLYNVIKDMFLVNCMAVYNMKKLSKYALQLQEIVGQLSSCMYQLYQMVLTIPNIQTFLMEDKVRFQTMKKAKDMIQATLKMITMFPTGIHRDALFVLPEFTDSAIGQDRELADYFKQPVIDVKYPIKVIQEECAKKVE